jgi:hypothetical protein
VADVVGCCAPSGALGRTLSFSVPRWALALRGVVRKSPSHRRRHHRRRPLRPRELWVAPKQPAQKPSSAGHLPLRGVEARAREPPPRSLLFLSPSLGTWRRRRKSQRAATAQRLSSSAAALPQALELTLSFSVPRWASKEESESRHRAAAVVVGRCAPSGSGVHSLFLSPSLGVEGRVREPPPRSACRRRLLRSLRLWSSLSLSQSLAGRRRKSQRAATAQRPSSPAAALPQALELTLSFSAPRWALALRGVVRKSQSPPPPPPSPAAAPPGALGRTQAACPEAVLRWALAFARRRRKSQRAATAQPSLSQSLAGHLAASKEESESRHRAAAVVVGCCAPQELWGALSLSQSLAGRRRKSQRAATAQRPSSSAAALPQALELTLSFSAPRWASKEESESRHRAAAVVVGCCAPSGSGAHSLFLSPSLGTCLERRCEEEPVTAAATTVVGRCAPGSSGSLAPKQQPAEKQSSAGHLPLRGVEGRAREPPPRSGCRRRLLRSPGALGRNLSLSQSLAGHLPCAAL